MLSPSGWVMKPVCAQRTCATISEPRQLAHRMKGDLRIVGAGLDRQIAAGAGLDQLVAVEARQVDERRRPLCREAVAVLSVLDEQPGAEAEGQVSRAGGRPSASPVSGPGTVRS